MNTSNEHRRSIGSSGCVVGTREILSSSALHRGRLLQETRISSQIDRGKRNDKQAVHGWRTLQAQKTADVISQRKHA